jgi:hypothetical protein
MGQTIFLYRKRVMLPLITLRFTSRSLNLVVSVTLNHHARGGTDD